MPGTILRAMHAFSLLILALAPEVPLVSSYFTDQKYLIYTFSFSLSVQYLINYMRYSTLYHKIGFVLMILPGCRLI